MCVCVCVCLCVCVSLSLSVCVCACVRTRGPIAGTIPLFGISCIQTPSYLVFRVMPGFVRGCILTCPQYSDAGVRQLLQKYAECRLCMLRCSLMMKFVCTDA